MKTRERTKDAAAAVQANRRDSCSAKRVQASSTTFGMKAEPLTLPCRDDVLIENGTTAPKSRLSLLKMRTPTVAGGLLPADKASTSTRIIFYQSRRRFCPTKETNSERTSNRYASYYSIFWRIISLLAAPSCLRVIKTKSGQTLGVDPGGSTGHLRACPFLGNVARVALWRGVR